MRNYFFEVKIYPRAYNLIMIGLYLLAQNEGMREEALRIYRDLADVTPTLAKVKK